ncbi:MAG: hypothetical protein KDE20_09350, partial [Caldilineaceae bacterium]|nr:hypothetical protein [Caldilineaceae bacterium]
MRDAHPAQNSSATKPAHRLTRVRRMIENQCRLHFSATSFPTYTGTITVHLDFQLSSVQMFAPSRRTPVWPGKESSMRLLFQHEPRAPRRIAL